MKISNINKKNIISSLKFCFVIPIAVMARKWNKDIWLVTERSNQARDNGYCFFKYLREQRPECKVYYIIDKYSDDYKKIEKYGNIIHFDSWKHYYYYCLSTIHISAHVGGCMPSNSPICRRLKRFLKTKNVFIPHGVSYGISEFCLQKYAQINLFICSGKTEYENVLKNYGYQREEVAYTGFPRLDQWHEAHVNKQQIILMPTWRSYISLNPDIVFDQTQYYQKYQELIQDRELQIFLRSHNLKLVFYLHNDMQKFVDYFKCDCNNIEIVYQENQYDIQELLKESAIMITDYSSVHFDFAYMKKPVIYYQFDRQDFFSKQYLPGTFHFENEGFGPVVHEKKQLIEMLKSMWELDFQMIDEYYNRMRKFYQIYDKKNCERVYQAIKKI